MGEHALDRDTLAFKEAADLEQGRGIGLDARTVTIRIDLHQHLEPRAPRLPAVSQQSRGFHAVQDQRQPHVAGLQRRNVIELVRCDADRIQDVLDAMVGEVVRFQQRRHRDRALGRRHQAARHSD